MSSQVSGSEHPAFSKVVQECFDESSTSRSVALASWGLGLAILLIGAAAAFFSGSPMVFLLALVFSVAVSGGSLWVLRLVAKGRQQRSLKKLYQPLVSKFKSSDQWAFAVELENLIALAPQVCREDVYLIELVGESFDFSTRSLLSLENLTATFERTSEVEDLMANVQSTWIHLSEGLVENTEESVVVIPELKNELASAESKAKLVECSLRIEKSLKKEIEQASAFARGTIGQPKDVKQTKIEEFLKQKRLDRAFLFRDFAALFK